MITCNRVKVNNVSVMSLWLTESMIRIPTLVTLVYLISCQKVVLKIYHVLSLKSTSVCWLIHQSKVLMDSGNIFCRWNDYLIHFCYISISAQAVIGDFFFLFYRAFFILLSGVQKVKSQHYWLKGKIASFQSTAVAIIWKYTFH